MKTPNRLYGCHTEMLTNVGYINHLRYHILQIVQGEKSFAVFTDHMLPGVQITAGLGFFLCSGRVSDSEDNNSLLL